MPAIGLWPWTYLVLESPRLEILNRLKLLGQRSARKPQMELILLGPSMGGRIALEFTLAHQDLVIGLILVGAVGVQENKERLKDISLPCLAIWGEADSISPLANGHLLQQGIKDAELTVIQGAAHPCYLDQPDEWHRILLRFLTEKLPV